MNLIAEVGDLPEISGSFRAGGVMHLLFHFFHDLTCFEFKIQNSKFKMKKKKEILQFLILGTSPRHNLR
jgi:hypothetical protein